MPSTRRAITWWRARSSVRAARSPPTGSPTRACRSKSWLRPRSDDERLERLGREQLLGRAQRPREPLLLVVAQKRRKHVAVGAAQPVGPVVLAQELPRVLEVLVQPRLHEPQRGGVVDAGVRLLLGLGQGLVQ